MRAFLMGCVMASPLMAGLLAMACSSDDGGAPQGSPAGGNEAGASSGAAGGDVGSGGSTSTGSGGAPGGGAGAGGSTSAGSAGAPEGEAGSGGSAGAESGGGEPSYCDVYTERLRECGVIDDGRFICVDLNDEAEVCEMECVVEASCDAVMLEFCAVSGTLSECQWACTGLEPYQCPDGESIDPLWVCDEVDDCPAGEDEVDCEGVIPYRFKCRNVDESIDDGLYCDGNPDCSDGSDEPSSCEDLFECDDGLEIPGVYVCDGFQDCFDAEDEPEDCAQILCSF